MLQVFSSRCCKSSPDIAYTCMLQTYFSCGFRCFIRLLQVFHQNVAYMFAVVFKCFSGVFASVSDVYFKCFICLLCMLQLLHLDVSKDRSGVAHGICVGSDWRCEQRLVRRRPATRTLAHKPDALGCSLTRCTVPSYTSALDGRPNSSKSVCKTDDSHAHYAVDCTCSAWLMRNRNLPAFPMTSCTNA
jgi:hypothetical protein